LNALPFWQVIVMDELNVLAEAEYAEMSTSGPIFGVLQNATAHIP
jgi:hypothetical protein